MITCLRIIFGLYLLLLINIYGINCTKSERFVTVLRQPVSVPIRGDLFSYLNVTRRITKFFYKNLNDIDLNVYFGLFLTNVNLKHTKKKERWYFTGAPRDMLNEIIDINSEIIKFFQDISSRDVSKLTDVDKIIYKHFLNESQWIDQIEHFSSAELDANTPDEVRYLFYSFNKYTEKIEDLNNAVPSPKKSDECLASLGGSSTMDTQYATCKIDPSCRAVVKDGTNYGYALTHRLLTLLIARYSHGCNIFSNHEDRYLARRFCAMLYFEAQYIASHSFGKGLVDLMLEIMCLCGLNGHAQFLNPTWLKSIQHFQTSTGCFGDYINDVTYVYRKGKLQKRKKNHSRDIIHGRCDVHCTTLASATYSQAIRFIIEAYY